MLITETSGIKNRLGGFFQPKLFALSNVGLDINNYLQ